MSTKSSLLRLLSDHAGEFVSGEKVGEVLGVSRAAVSKACAALREDGYRIESKTNKGYMLARDNNVLTKDGISTFVEVPCSLEVFDVVTSTNEVAKTIALDDFDRGSAASKVDFNRGSAMDKDDFDRGSAAGTNDKPIPKVIIADRQTAGKGRLGRRFESPAGTGLYMTIVFRPDFDIREALFVTMASAVGTCRAIEKVSGVHPGIKWVNDLYLDGKKICGILTEAQSDFETGNIDRLITGIGVNCFPGSFPPEVADIAGSVSDKAGAFSREKLAAEMINETLPLITAPDTDRFLAEYKRRCFMLGSTIKIHPNYNDEGTAAEALDIADDGGLIVKYLEGEKAGMEEVLHTGEISISIG